MAPQLSVMQKQESIFWDFHYKIAPTRDLSYNIDIIIVKLYTHKVSF